MNLTGLGFPLDGWFAVWKVGVAEGVWRQQQAFAVYVNGEGQSFGKAAQRLWDELATRQIEIEPNGETLDYDFAALMQTAEVEAAEMFDAIVTRTRHRARSRLQALELSYLARRTMLARIGLETVREARRRELKAEYEQRKGRNRVCGGGSPRLAMPLPGKGNGAMKWVDSIVDALRPAFGGIPTFVEDPDHLLDVAEVREALRACGMTLSDWKRAACRTHSAENAGPIAAMPLLIVGNSGQRHIVDACLQDFRWEGRQHRRTHAEVCAERGQSDPDRDVG